MRRLTPLVAVLVLSATPVLAGGLSTPSLPSTGILSLAAAGVVAAIYLARRKR